ncbi:MAG: hypothetical protein QM601_04590 [Pseudoxanthomonas sp.]
MPMAAGAQTVVPAENVRLDYAQVLAVEPVYQTLRASRMEQQCDQPAPAPPDDDDKAADEDEEGRFARMFDSVKSLFGEGKDKKEAAKEAKPAPLPRNCRMVQVDREFRRPIAYDVDYMYKGVKYRSRLTEDPGNRLRIRVSVMPYVPGPPPPGSAPPPEQ